MKLKQTSRSKAITITLVSLQLLLLASILVTPVFGNESLSDNNKSMNENAKSLSENFFQIIILRLLLILSPIEQLCL